MTDLTNDEYTLLLIASQGESVIPIGRWEKSVESLVERGLLHRYDRFNNVITDAGRAAMKAREAQDDGDLKQALRSVALVQNNAQAEIEAAARHLVNAARMSIETNGESINTALISWHVQLLQRAREIAGA